MSGNPEKASLMAAIAKMEGTDKNLMADKALELDVSAAKAKEDKQKLDAALDADNPFLGMEGYDPMNKGDVKPSPSGEDAVLAFEVQKTKEAIAAARDAAMAAADTNPGIAMPEVVDMTGEVTMDEEGDTSRGLPREQAFIGRPPEGPRPQASA